MSTPLALDARTRAEIEERRKQVADRRIFSRLCALLWLDDGMSQERVAPLLGITPRQVRKWVRTYRTRGLDGLTTLHYQGDPAQLRRSQIERLKAEIQAGRFHNVRQIADWIEQTSGSATPRAGSRRCCVASGPVTTRSAASS